MVLKSCIKCHPFVVLQWPQCSVTCGMHYVQYLVSWEVQFLIWFVLGLWHILLERHFLVLTASAVTIVLRRDILSILTFVCFDRIDHFARMTFYLSLVPIRRRASQLFLTLLLKWLSICPHSKSKRTQSKKSDHSKIKQHEYRSLGYQVLSDSWESTSMFVLSGHVASSIVSFLWQEFTTACASSSWHARPSDFVSLSSKTGSPSGYHAVYLLWFYLPILILKGDIMTCF